MRKTILFIGLWTVGMVATNTGRAGSIFQDRAGIGLRGSYWSMRNEETMVHVSSHSLFTTEVDVGGAGGWLTFFSGIGERGVLEFSLGAVGRAKVTENGLFNDHVDVSGVTPVLLGYQHLLFKDGSVSAFQPYLSVGGGPYFLGSVHVHDHSLLYEEVTVKNKVRPGVYAAAGGYFVLSRWFAMHGEMRYHLVDFKTNNDASGFELGLGMAFSWKR